MKKVYYDMEFTGLHQKTTPISIGLVADSGEEFYAEFNDYDQSQVDSWIYDNVITNLIFDPPNPGENEYWSWCKDNKVVLRGNKETVKLNLLDWFQALLGGPLSWVDYSENEPAIVRDPGIELYSDCLAYDWVLFCELFGGAMSVPGCIYYIPQDLCSYFRLLGIDPDVNREEFAYGKNDYKGENKHNSLWDAKVIKDCFNAILPKK